MQEALARFTRNRTTIVIAHRLSTVQRADMICVMDDGRLVEKGTHAELLALDGAYARLCRSQVLVDLDLDVRLQRLPTRKLGRLRPRSSCLDIAASGNGLGDSGAGRLYEALGLVAPPSRPRPLRPRPQR